MAYDIMTGHSYISIKDLKNIHHNLANQTIHLITCDNKYLSLVVGPREYVVVAGDVERYRGNEFAIAMIEYNSWQHNWDTGKWVRIDSNLFAEDCKERTTTNDMKFIRLVDEDK